MSLDICKYLGWVQATHIACQISYWVDKLTSFSIDFVNLGEMMDYSIGIGQCR